MVSIFQTIPWKGADRYDDEYLEGSVNFYCAHKNCCTCSVLRKADLFRQDEKIKCVLLIHGSRKHSLGCCQARPFRGEELRKLQNELASKSACKLHRELKMHQSDGQRIYGADTYVPSKSVLRKIRSEAGTPFSRSADVTANLKTLAQKYREDGSNFLRAW